MLTKKEDVTMIKLTNMQERGLSISLQQLKMKVVKLTQQGIHHSEMEYRAILDDIGSNGDT